MKMTISAKIKLATILSTILSEVLFGPLVQLCALLSVWLPLMGGLASAADKEKEAVKIHWRDPAVWTGDGMWTVAPVEDGLEFAKDKTPAHNSMCWMKLARVCKRNDTIEITYRMEKPYKHVDMFLGQDCGQPHHGQPLPEFAEVVSLGGIPGTNWQTRRLTSTSDQAMNTLGFLCWGWPVDRNSWMRVASIRVIPGDEEAKWSIWRVAPHRNEKSSPARSPLQDFFPLGVYLSLGDCNGAAQREGKGLWQWLDEVLADLAKRGLNFTSLVNFSEVNLDRVVQLHRKHGLRMNPQVSQFDVKHNPYDLALKKLKRAVFQYRDSGVIAGWAAGEEFRPARVPILDLPHEIIPAVDPRNTLVTIHNRTQAFEVIGQRADVRIAFRDIYPFFNNPRVGPTTFETSMNYFEDEIDKCQRWLPRGASLWVMPQAQGEHGYIRTPTPAEIKVQAWSAIAHGAQGLAYFIYHSAPAAEEGRLKFDGLRALDGSPTDRLEALTELAGTLAPLGPVITQWHRSRVPAATDNRFIRAYLFGNPHGKGYAVIYNRNVEQPSMGRVRVPLAVGDSVADLVKPGKIPSETSDGKSIFPVTLPPGEGIIVSLGVKLPREGTIRLRQ
jgi:hypothetical protein